MTEIGFSELPTIVKTPHFCEVRIDEIRVENRHRVDLGDVKKLADSIEDLGLIHPVVITPDNQLVAGERRLAAMRSLGWVDIPVTVIQTLADATDRLLAERDENTCRKDFTASELVALGRQLEELERPKAQERMREGGRRGANLTNHGVSPTEPTPPCSTDKVVGEALGVSQSTYKRAKTVVKASQDDDPVVAEVAREQLIKLDAGQTTLSAADQAVRNARSNLSSTEVKPSDPEVIPGLPTKVHGPRPNHLKVLQRVVISLGGTVIAVDDITELNDTVNAEEALRISKDLSKSIRALNRINNLLKERTK